jgi:hypothetical protein
MNRSSRILLLSGALVLVVVLLVLLGVATRNGGALEQYQAALRAKGEKLSFAELTCGRQPNAVDSHAVITNAAYKLGGAGLSPGLLELRKYTGPGQAKANWAQASPIWSPSAGSVSNVTWEEFAAHVEAVQSTLGEIRQALKEPAANAGPCTNMLTVRRVNFVAIRTAAQWLMGAAESELRQGRLEEALPDLEALAGLAQMERDEPTLVAQMIRIAAAGLGLEATWEALQAPGWTEPKLERLQKAWEPVNLVEALEKGLAGERASGNEIFTQIRHSSGPQTGRLLRSWWGGSPKKGSFPDLMMTSLYLPAYKLACINDDELFYLKTMEETLTAPRLLKARQPWSEATQAINKVGVRINTVASRPDKFRYFFSLISIPSFVRAIERAVHVETERQMTLAAIALKRYQLRHGNLPSSLESLVPEFLPVPPYDPMSGKTLCYRLKPAGGCLLYSVGEDGKDDGGDATPVSGKNPGLWEGRDVVWPSVAGR